jgi:sugar/nucleoside kinase (ribokinase family)
LALGQRREQARVIRCRCRPGVLRVTPPRDRYHRRHLRLGRDAVGAAIDAAAEADVPVSFDVNHRPSLRRGTDPRPLYRELAASARFVFAGRDEGALLVGDGTDEEIVCRLAALGPTTVTLKLGVEGALVLHEGVLLRRSAIPIVPRDTVGAGDAFVAGFLAEWLRAEPSRPAPAEPDAIVGIGPRLKVGVRSLRAM